MLTRYILEKCKTTKEAIEFIKKVPIASAQTLTIADNTGDIKVVECNCDKVIFKESLNRVYATNIFVSREMIEYNPINFDDWRAKERYSTLKNAFNNCKSYDIEFAKDLLSGKYGFICQYDRKTGADTVWSVVYDIKNKKIYRCEGNPKRKKFIEDKRMKWLSSE